MLVMMDSGEESLECTEEPDVLRLWALPGPALGPRPMRCILAMPGGVVGR
jgi:hypothetical protein